MKIFVFALMYPTEQNRQYGIFVHEQSKALQRMGHDVTVIDSELLIPRQWKDQAASKIVQREWEGVKVYSYHSRGIATTKLQYLNEWLYRGHAEKLFSYVYEKEGRPDIIYGHFAAKAGTSAVRMAKKYHLPVAVIEHGGNIMVPQRSPYLGGVLKYISDRADALICVSTKQKEFVEKHCRKTDRMYVVPNMVEPMFDYCEHEKGQPFTFFAAGNLYKMKRMDLLINAYADVFSEDDPVVLRIAGLGWEQEHLESIIKERHLENRVSLLGRLDRHQIYDEYVNCDVFAMASEHESFGIAYREAMCVGRPVVSSENGGIREGWSPKFGLLVPVDDREALGKALRSIYEKYDQYELKEISALNREQTSPENVMGQLISIFEKAILNHRK